MSNAPLYVRFRGHVRGPYKPEQVQEMVQSRQISDLHEISTDSINWITLGQHRVAEAKVLQAQLEAQRQQSERAEQERRRAETSPSRAPTVIGTPAPPPKPHRVAWILPVSITVACVLVLVAGGMAFLFSSWPTSSRSVSSGAPRSVDSKSTPVPATMPGSGQENDSQPATNVANPGDVVAAPAEGDRIDTHVGIVVTQVLVRFTLVQDPTRFLEKWLCLGHGTGFVISQDGFMLTNRHVVRDPDLKMGVAHKSEDQSRLIEILNYRHFVRFGEAAWNEAKLEYCSESRDVAILMLPEKSSFPEPFQVATAITRGSHVVVYGFSGLASKYAKLLSPEAAREAEARAAQESENIQEYLNDRYSARDYSISQTDGTVSRIVHTEQGDLVQMTATIHGGNSGGPVIDALGRVVAIVTETFGNESDKISGAYSLGEMLDDLRRMAPAFARRVQTSDKLPARK